LPIVGFTVIGEKKEAPMEAASSINTGAYCSKQLLQPWQMADAKNVKSQQSTGYNSEGASALVMLCGQNKCS